MTGQALETFGLFSIIIMVTSYALEKRHAAFIATFAAGCVLAAIYAWLIKSYPFMIAEGIWAIIAINRWFHARRI